MADCLLIAANPNEQQQDSLNHFHKRQRIDADSECSSQTISTSQTAERCSDLTGSGTCDRKFAACTHANRQWSSLQNVSPRGTASQDIPSLQQHVIPIPVDGDAPCPQHNDLQTNVPQLPPVDAEARVDAAEIVCYGLLDDFDIVLLDVDPSQARLEWDEHDQLRLSSGHLVSLSSHKSRILSDLVEEAGVTFDFELQSMAQSINRHHTRKRYFVERSPAKALSVIVYGPRHAADEIGHWLNDLDLYLQLPSKCSRQVPYYNPQAMTSLTGRVFMTSELSSKPNIDSDTAAIDHVANNLLDLCTRTCPEAEQPSLIRSQLHPHQRQALTFLQGRELGWDLYNDRGTNDLWQRKLDSFGREKYFATLSQESRYKPPLEFKGGMLADDMGLGKTCTMLSLIASDLSVMRTENHRADLKRCPTLIVVPLPLLQVWEKQIREHFFPDAVDFSTYHGPKRTTTTFSDCDIVITTYHVVAKEWKVFRKCTSLSKETPPLYATCWRRIVLDEAHVIKSRTTNVARAASALRGDRRWCITGTLIQNRSSDIYSLLRFLGVYPYNDQRLFEATFVDPWVSCADKAALQKLQLLITTIAIRRPRATIKLPPREDSTHLVDFTDEERDLYTKAKSGVSQSIEIAITEISGRQCGVSYLNALQKINDLRYICNLGTTPRSKKTFTSLAQEHETTLIRHDLHMILNDDAAPVTICEACGFDLLDYQEEGNQLLTVDQHQSQDLVISDCPSCGATDCGVQIKSSIALRSPTDSSPARLDAHPHRPSKVCALLREIRWMGSEEKCVVFSYWTSTLKVIGQALDDEGISFLLYDGSLTRFKKDAVLRSFTDDHNIKALLVSITCGGQGLDLTVANHAFIFEPQWNPMLEEQAIARVHRLGQVKPVRLTRLIVRDTWEEKIVTLQKRKRLLADLIVDRRGGGEGEEARQQLLQLRDLVS